MKKIVVLIVTGAIMFTFSSCVKDKVLEDMPTSDTDNVIESVPIMREAEIDSEYDIFDYESLGIEKYVYPSKFSMGKI